MGNGCDVRATIPVFMDRYDIDYDKVVRNSFWTRIEMKVCDCSLGIPPSPLNNFLMVVSEIKVYFRLTGRQKQNQERHSKYQRSYLLTRTLLDICSAAFHLKTNFCDHKTVHQLTFQRTVLAICRACLKTLHKHWRIWPAHLWDLTWIHRRYHNCVWRLANAC